MKLVEHHDLLNSSRFETSNPLKRAWENVQSAIAATDWPHGSGTFTIHPGKHVNGVNAIKIPCIARLGKLGWQTECLPTIEKGILTCGDLDALLLTDEGPVAFEWETGNISSSHRALNKLLLTSQIGELLGSFLVVPSNALYPHLTDRIGNIRELKPYFPLWRSIAGARGGLRVVVVEQDASSTEVPRIPKGTDGRALR